MKASKRGSRETCSDWLRRAEIASPGENPPLDTTTERAPRGEHKREERAMGRDRNKIHPEGRSRRAVHPTSFFLDERSRWAPRRGFRARLVLAGYLRAGVEQRTERTQQPRPTDPTCSRKLREARVAAPSL